MTSSAVRTVIAAPSQASAWITSTAAPTSVIECEEVVTGPPVGATPYRSVYWLVMASAPTFAISSL
jgi:hypothetical protein